MCDKGLRVRSALHRGRVPITSLGNWGVAEWYQSEVGLRAVCKVVSSRVLFMGVKPATYIDRRLRGI